ncbi:MAG: hypothetical protein ACRD4Z_00575 [Nitrososphaeraceae archaeon]
MTQMFFDKKPEDNDDDWTTARLADEFFLCLCCEKHYNQAKDLMFRIPLTEQYPTEEGVLLPFVIDWSDLSPKIQAEFSEYCKHYSKVRIRIFLKQAVIRLFENLDYSHAHMSVMKKLRVRLSC